MIAANRIRADLLDAPEAVQAAARYEWRLWARPNQIEPEGTHRFSLLLAGRGFGKTRAGVEWVRENIESGRASRAIVVAPTAGDCRDTIVEGPSGFLAVCPPWDRPQYEPSKRRLTWKSGATVGLYSAEEPDRLRGVNCDLMLADELAAWTRPDTWDMAMFALRIGSNPRAMITTTPRPTRLIRDLIDNPETHLVRGSTFENEANLAPQFLEEILRVLLGFWHLPCVRVTVIKKRDSTIFSRVYANESHCSSPI